MKPHSLKALFLSEDPIEITDQKLNSDIFRPHQRQIKLIVTKVVSGKVVGIVKR